MRMFTKTSGTTDQLAAARDQKNRGAPHARDGQARENDMFSTCELTKGEPQTEIIQDADAVLRVTERWHRLKTSWKSSNLLSKPRTNRD